MKRQRINLAKTMTEAAAGGKAARRISLSQRSCGDCTACCEHLGVTELGKPPQCRCEHQVDRGCSAYQTRPDSCRNYRCLWLQNWGLDSDRPNTSGIILDIRDDGTAKHLCITETRLGAVVGRFPVDVVPPEFFSVAKSWGASFVQLYLYGIPRARTQAPANGYTSDPRQDGRDHFVSVGSSPVSFGIHVGVITPDGIIHSRGVSMPAEDLDAMLTWSAEPLRRLMEGKELVA